jgi:hypothetical protein
MIAQTRSPGRRRAALVIGSFIALAIVSFVSARPNYTHSWPVDFNAFYCGGATAASHHDPYRTEPLRTCENEARGFPPGRGLQFAVPAPLPGYALAPFALLSRMPFRLASFVWVAVLRVSSGRSSCYASSAIGAWRRSSPLSC